jgi:Uncharacterized iron-regulated membrane protein
VDLGLAGDRRADVGVDESVGPVVRPIVSLFSTLTPNPVNNPEILRAPHRRPIAESRARGATRRASRSSAEPEGAAGRLYYAEFLHAYGVGFYATGNDHGDHRPRQSVDVLGRGTGKLLGAQIPGKGTAGDIFMQVQFPLHSGRILGLGGGF